MFTERGGTRTAIRQVSVQRLKRLSYLSCRDDEGSAHLFYTGLQDVATSYRHGLPQEGDEAVQDGPGEADVGLKRVLRGRPRSALLGVWGGRHVTVTEDTEPASYLRGQTFDWDL